MNKIILRPDEFNPFIRDVGEQGYDQWPNSPRRLYDYELIYCYNGKGTIILNEHAYAIGPKFLFLIPPNTPSLLSIDKSHTSCMHWIHFDFVRYNSYSDDNIKKYIKECCQSLYQKNLPDSHLIRPSVLLHTGLELPYYLHDTDGMIGNLINQVITVFNEKRDYWELESKIHMEKIILELIKNGSIVQKNQTSTSVIHFIQNNYYKYINLDEIASYMSMNKDILMKTFKKEIGTSIIKFLVDYRIQKAKQLLIYTDQSMKEIAFHTGFNDQFYFSKVFKKQLGLSPKEYRLKHKAKKDLHN